eukprot:gene6613-6349_t
MSPTQIMMPLGGCTLAQDAEIVTLGSSTETNKPHFTAVACPGEPACDKGPGLSGQDKTAQVSTIGVPGFGPHLHQPDLRPGGGAAAQMGVAGQPMLPNLGGGNHAARPDPLGQEEHLGEFVSPAKLSAGLDQTILFHNILTGVQCCCPQHDALAVASLLPQ